MKDIAERVTKIIMAANGFNRISYGPLPVPNPINGDIWYKFEFDTPNQVEMRIWQDGIWVIIIDDFLGERIQEKFDELDKEFETTETKLNTNITKTDTLFNEWEELKDNLDFAQQEMFLNIIGDDGRWVYSDNRLYIKGTPSNEITSNEYILKLEDDNAEFTHNGNGFNLGEDYLLSWIVERVERPKSNVTFSLTKPLNKPHFVTMNPENSFYPSRTGSGTSLNDVYHDNYQVIITSDWYALYTANDVAINSNRTLSYTLALKRGIITVNHNNGATVKLAGQTPTKVNNTRHTIDVPYADNEYTVSIEMQFYHTQTRNISVNPTNINPSVTVTLIRKDGIWEWETWTESVPFETSTINDVNVRAENSFIQTQGVNGVRTWTEEQEFIDGIFTGETRNKSSEITLQPVTQVYINGTAVIEWRNAQRTEVVPYTSSTYETSLYYEGETVVTTVGVNGVRTFTWQNEYMNNVATGNERNHANSITTAPINERIAIGTRPRTADVTVSSISVSGRQIATANMSPINAVVPDLQKIAYITVNGIQYTVEIRTNFQGDYLYFLDPLIPNGTHTLVITYYLD